MLNDELAQRLEELKIDIDAVNIYVLLLQNYADLSDKEKEGMQKIQKDFQRGLISAQERKELNQQLAIGLLKRYNKAIHELQNKASKCLDILEQTA